jgi:hypothetical protein
MSSDSPFYEVGDSNIPTIHLPVGMRYQAKR